LTTQAGALLASLADDEDPCVRRELARQLSTLPEPAAQALLTDPDRRVREAAALEAGAAQVASLGLLLSQDPSRQVRRAAAETLGALGEEAAIEALLSGLEDDDRIVRAAVLRGLERLLTRPAVIERLCSELRSVRPRRRRASMYALADLEALEVATEVWRLADDPDPEVRLALVGVAHSVVAEPDALLSYLATDAVSTIRHSAEVQRLRRPHERAAAGSHQ
jgi:HEAT repeat protein